MHKLHNLPTSPLGSDNPNKLIGCLNRMISTFETDFHEIFVPESFCIEIENERRKRMGKRNA